ncbi:helix-turn-helix domain-containing protein [Tuanshanicoccus lijuaniae]|uniref:ArsR/SmtB family transcription factor n=1 Tax=Aerococcaceae bacterium zg-1292 TaxID=2774330 RepID=UPI001938E1FA|nr:helix-turn-helix domain-containing protein [Aerococcaceae bacterium zg-1292]MBF6625961.1 helix-turn-helix domain-containing protein [Aerococcaceae bacterium zg-BR9]QQA36864.1 helix-turn-helix domain-containing protein [Aerococcaceae bacterium zg-1292]
MQTFIDNESLSVYEALSSRVRLEIIQLLSQKKMNIKEIADALSLSSAIITSHVNKLENAKIIKTEKVGQQKISSLAVDKIEINFPKKIFSAFDVNCISIPIGHYTDFSIKPTCGLASESHFIGYVDDPKYFIIPERIDAQILWFTQGYVEYQIPNLIQSSDTLEMIDIALEISSEFPFANDNWPSDITFSLNDIEIGTWTSPGDFADTRGVYTPEWYPDNLNQYGLLKTLRITSHGTYIDAESLSTISTKDFSSDAQIWKFRIEVKENATNVGGCTLFGNKFGNHPQDIVFKTYTS